VKLLISASNILATTIDIICDKAIPIPRHMTKDIAPMERVSKNKILDILHLLIPNVIYIPNSLFLLYIKKLLA